MDLSSLKSSSASSAKLPLIERNIRKPFDVSLSSFAFLYVSIIQYSQNRVSGISDLERRLSDIGRAVGLRLVELIAWREKQLSSSGRRECRLTTFLYALHTSFFKTIFGSPADSLERSTTNADEYMIAVNEPMSTNRFVAVPKEMSQLNTNAFVAGIIEAACGGNGFKAKVTAHSVPILPNWPQRTVFLMKFEQSIIEREKEFEN